MDRLQASFDARVVGNHWISLNQLGKRQYGIHRRAQLMAHAREELGFGLIRGLGCLPGHHQITGALLNSPLQLVLNFL